jgi:Fe-S-cluster containining protein
VSSEHLVQLRLRVDRHFDEAVARSPASFACGPGCDRCCHQRFSVFEVEAAPIREALADLGRRDPELRRRIREQGRDATRDAIYEQRPLICRSHGLPIALRDLEAPEDAPLRLDHCPLNFREAAPPRASILMLDAVNRPLALLAELAAPGRPRVELAELAATADEARGRKR